MTINYGLTGNKRKALAAAVGRETSADVRYLNAPTYAYEVGDYLVDRHGALRGADNADLAQRLAALGYVPISVEYDTNGTDTGVKTAEVESMETEIENAETADENSGESGVEIVENGNSLIIGDRLAFEIPLDGFTPDKFENLSKLIAAKGGLIKAALGVDELTIEQTTYSIRFPWFRLEQTPDSETISAFAMFVSALCKAAIDKKRVTAKEKDALTNPKYAFRCFLLSLGFIGDEYREARRVLLSRLEGNSSWRDGKSENP